MRRAGRTSLVDPTTGGLKSPTLKFVAAGLDYWQHLDLQIVDSFDEFRDQLPDRTRIWFCSRFAKRSPWDATMRRGDAFVFGSESSGLPPDILDPDDPHSLRLPTDAKVRSLNLATTAGVFLYEHHRQTGGPRLMGWMRQI